LRQNGLNAVYQDDEFPQDTEDQDWLIEVGAKGWIVFTRDVKIRRRPDEQAALMLAKVRLFSLQTRDVNGALIREIFLKHIDKIKHVAVNQPAPFVASVTRNGVAIMKFPVPRARGKRTVE
jgi:hypothetical protein